MTKQDIKDRINLFFPDIMCAHMGEIDEKCPLFGQGAIDELDILDLLTAVDKEFGTNLWDDVDVYKVSIEDIVTLIEQEVNR